MCCLKYLFLEDTVVVTIFDSTQFEKVVGPKPDQPECLLRPCEQTKLT